MLRVLALVMVVASGCVAASDGPTATVKIQPDTAAPQVAGAAHRHEIEDLSGQPDLCGLAAALPTTDACSLICDPDALAQFLVDEGMRTGTCYQLRCVLDDTTAVSVGVCLAQ